MHPPPPQPWHSYTLTRALEELGIEHEDEQQQHQQHETSFWKTGLSLEQVKHRLETQGRNQLHVDEKRSTKPFLMNVLYYLPNLPAMFLVHAIMWFLLGHYLSLEYQILTAVFYIVGQLTVGCGQMADAERRLRDMLSTTTCTVIRQEGHTLTIPVQDIVTGDVVVLKRGDTVPADVRLVQASHNLACHETDYTNEQPQSQCKTTDVMVDIPTPPCSRNMCYTNTVVAQGSGVGLVVATGNHTVAGRAVSGHRL